MDEEIERLVISVRTDTAGFARDVGAMRNELEGPFASGVGRTGRLIDAALGRAVSNGKIGFDDLKNVALSALSEIAGASLRGSAGGSAAGMSPIGGLLAGLVGLPGRATGGPVEAGRPYIVGERGPEVFVPHRGGRIEQSGHATRNVSVSIAVKAGHAELPRALQQSSRQIARAVKAAISR